MQVNIHFFSIWIKISTFLCYLCITIFTSARPNSLFTFYIYEELYTKYKGNRNSKISITGFDNLTWFAWQSHRLKLLQSYEKYHKENLLNVSFINEPRHLPSAFGCGSWFCEIEAWFHFPYLEWLHLLRRRPKIVQRKQVNWSTFC